MDWHRGANFIFRLYCVQAWWVASFPDERHLAILGLVTYSWKKRPSHNPGYFSDGGEEERGSIS